MPRPRKSTLIRNERKATTARKRAAFEFQAPNKKAPPKDGAYNFRAAGTPPRAPAANRNTPNQDFEESRHEFMC
jgi:hypothetical protein